jgi:ribosome-binding protein aMBF1 (putative translation factor)
MRKNKIDTSFESFLQKQLKDPEIKAEYDALEPEFALVQALIDARQLSGLTQQQLFARTGIAQSDISKFENGNGNPSLKTLRRLAAGMGMRLKVEFEPLAALK